MPIRTQYDIDSDQRISSIEYALLDLDKDDGGKIKSGDNRYSYDDLVCAMLVPELVGELSDARPEWVEAIRAKLHEVIRADGVTAGEALMGLGRILTSAGGYIVRDERNEHKPPEYRR